jgi:hypothetical protein
MSPLCSTDRMFQHVVQIRAAARVVVCGIVLLWGSSQAFPDAGDRPALPLRAEAVPRCLVEVQQEAEQLGISLQVVQVSTPNGRLVDSAAAWWREHPVDVLVWLDGHDGHLVSRWQSYRRARRTMLAASQAADWPCSLVDPLRELLGKQRQHRLLLLAIAGAGLAICAPAMWFVAGFRRRRAVQNST